MSVGKFTYHSVGAKHPELAADGGGTASSLLFGGGWFGIEQRLQVAVTQAVDGELATGDGAQ